MLIYFAMTNHHLLPVDLLESFWMLFFCNISLIVIKYNPCVVLLLFNWHYGKKGDYFGFLTDLTKLGFVSMSLQISYMG